MTFDKPVFTCGAVKTETQGCYVLTNREVLIHLVGFVNWVNPTLLVCILVKTRDSTSYNVSVGQV